MRNEIENQKSKKQNEKTNTKESSVYSKTLLKSCFNKS